MVKTILPLEISNASVRRRGKTLVGPVDLILAEKGFTTVIGPNGAGKTTLLRMMHGIERLSQGTVTWHGPNAEVRGRQAFVFQSPIMMRRSVRDNLTYPLTLGKTPKTEARQQAEDWAERINLKSALNRKATVLSGGERQKLAIARALIRKPDILFLDEPCSHLDGRATREIEELLQGAHEKGIRIIMSTHDMGQAKRLASEVVFILKGRIHEFSPADAFFDTPGTNEAKAFLSGDILE
ncbi:MAG: ATP-binding cassette domain-containing protein [Rhodobacteraceae bacterium]|nr:ATP-binding cassette domain-containing protein [Paracoccaceae bacterium]